MQSKNFSLNRAMIVLLAAAFCLVTGPARPSYSQAFNNIERAHARDMLNKIKDDIKKNYYDSNFRGMDIEARFKAADDKMKEATSSGQSLGIIAQVLLDMNDSHTFFLPPRRASRVEYGWQMKAVGDDCYVSAVKPGSDAEAKGLKVGDKVLSIDGRPLSRDKIWLAHYFYYALRPQPGMRLVIQKPDGQQQQMDVMAKVREGKKILNVSGDDNGEDIWNLMREEQEESHLNRHRFYEAGDDLLIWKMPQFDLDEDEVAAKVDKFRKRKALILDLRGNGGGYAKTLQWLAGYFFDHDVKIADLKGRKEMKPLIAKSRGNQIFKGQLIVLVDSESASAAELFARLVQIEKRGIVIGDRSAGAVMLSQHYPHQIGLDTVVYYGVSVTDADLIMTDGKSLEKVGVTPDELLLPTAADMAAQRDPVLARAAALAGVKLDAEKAGALFPTEWRK